MSEPGSLNYTADIPGPLTPEQKAAIKAGLEHCWRAGFHGLPHANFATPNPLTPAQNAAINRAATEVLRNGQAEGKRAEKAAAQRTADAAVVVQAAQAAALLLASKGRDGK